MQDKLVSSTGNENPDHARRIGSSVRIGPRGQANQPDIHVHKQGERIETIVITCSCGKQITINCDYAEDGT